MWRSIALTMYLASLSLGQSESGLQDIKAWFDQMTDMSSDCADPGNDLHHAQIIEVVDCEAHGARVDYMIQVMQFMP